MTEKTESEPKTNWISNTVGVIVVGAFGYLVVLGLLWLTRAVF